MQLINFMRWRYFFLGASLVVIAIGMSVLVTQGLRLSIDFTGGSLLEVQTSAPLPVDRAELQQLIGEGYHLNSVQETAERTYILKGAPLTNEQKDHVLTELRTQVPEVKELQFATVGPTLGRELVFKTITAALLAALLITLYVARQFTEWRYGVCAVLAMLHDSLILIGSFAILGMLFGVEVDVLFVTALLTTLSFSVHDTIVVYDRVRELRRTRPKLALAETINIAMVQTFARSLNNSLTIIMMLVALVVLGGESIRWFAVALLIGAVTGTYSSTFTAAPLLLVWDDVARKVTRGASVKVQ